MALDYACASDLVHIRSVLSHNFIHWIVLVSVVCKSGTILRHALHLETHFQFSTSLKRS